ncbi:MAG: hypothetical protein KAJ62_02225 [Desulfobacteraceae bacterium]|nr:hypothetical protein [Desulfobacteraceae bacterium]
MDTNSLLNISQLSNELDSGETIIKFLIKRFNQWITGIDHNGQKLYYPGNLVTLIILLDKINKGVLPSTIEKDFINNSIPIASSNDKQYFQTDTNLQQRTVEAMERRNEIETLKVEALTNLAKAMAGFDTLIPQNTNTKQNNIPVQTDDLSQLIDTENNVPEAETKVDQQIDDLASLIEPKQENHAELDDLSRLIQIDDTKIDNLSALLDDFSDNNLELDDLSLLINDSNTQNIQIDDLSILTNEPEFENGTMDDLSSLIDSESDKKFTIAKPEFSPIDDFKNYKSEIINIIIDLKNQGITEQETCEKFNKEGILTFSGKTNWSIKTISQVYQLINNAA